MSVNLPVGGLCDSAEEPTSDRFKQVNRIQADTVMGRPLTSDQLEKSAFLPAELRPRGSSKHCQTAELLSSY